MNKKITILLVSIFILSSCAPTAKLLEDYTQEAKLNDALKENILVVANTKDMKVRKVYEDRFVDELSKKNINAVQSYTKFPNLKDKRKASNDERKEIIKMFRENNIGAVFLMSLKETKTLTKEEKQPKPVATTTNYGKYRVTFTEMYNVNSNTYLTSLLEPNINDDYNNRLTSKQVFTSKIYILEGVFFNLYDDNTSELVADYTVSISEPDNAKEVLDKFSKIILKQLK